MALPLIRCQDVRFVYAHGGFGLEIPHFELHAGQSVFLHGDSGRGKSTALSLFAGVLSPQQGDVSLMGHALSQLSASTCDRLRVDHIGFVFQQFNLLNYLSVIDNVCLPCQFSVRRRQRAQQQGGTVQKAAQALLNTLGLMGLEKQAVSHLSVGQQQRVAAARALIGHPDLVIADEPTSALDESQRTQFMRLLLQVVQDHHTALIVVSHDQRLSSHFQFQQSIEDWHLPIEAA